MLQFLFSDICPEDSWCFFYLLKWVLFIMFVNFVQEKFKFILNLFFKWLTGDIEDVPEVKMAMTGYKVMNFAKEIPLIQNLTKGKSE